jgi:hypothetical protein
MVGQSVRGGSSANAISVNGTGPINPTWYIGKPQDTITGLVFRSRLSGDWLSALGALPNLMYLYYLTFFGGDYIHRMLTLVGYIEIIRRHRPMT